MSTSEAAPQRCLSVVIPAYNEQATIHQILDRVLASPFTAEVVVVDDASTDSTADIVRSITDKRVRLFEQSHNQGKGAALRRGFAEATYAVVGPSSPGTIADVLAPRRGVLVGVVGDDPAGYRALVYRMPTGTAP